MPDETPTELQECVVCGWMTSEAHIEYRQGDWGREDPQPICDVCFIASPLAQLPPEYVVQRVTVNDLMRMLSRCTNLVLDRILIELSRPRGG